MRSNRMRHRLRILKPHSETDGFRSERTVWREEGIVWAERVKVTPRYRVEADELFPDSSAQFRIRIFHDVKPNWRVEDSDGVLYTVGNTIPNVERGMLTLHCERVNL